MRNSVLDDFPLCPQCPPPPRSRKNLFLLSSRRLWPSGKSRNFPEFSWIPWKFLGNFPRTSLTLDLKSNPQVPRRKFPRLPRKFPEPLQRSTPLFGLEGHQRVPKSEGYQNQSFSSVLSGPFPPTLFHSFAPLFPLQACSLSHHFSPRHLPLYTPLFWPPENSDLGTPLI